MRAEHTPMQFTLCLTEKGELQCRLANGYTITMERDHWIDLLNIGNEIRLFIAVNAEWLPRDVEPSWKHNLQRFLQEREGLPAIMPMPPRHRRGRKQKQEPKPPTPYMGWLSK
jgi:hypothetical protein